MLNKTSANLNTVIAVKKSEVVVFLLVTMLLGTVFAVSVSAFEIQGLPGSTWGQITYDNDNLTGSGSMGNINQGVDWLTLPGGITLNTFAEYRYRVRAKNKLYYDTHGPALGIELKKSIFQAGFDFYWEYFPELGRTSNNREFFLIGFYDWDLKSSDKPRLLGLNIKGFPGSVWGILTYDVNGLNGSGAQGFVNQGINWGTLPGNIDLITFAEYRYRARTKNQQYYDASGPALGIEFRKSVFSWGIDYYWERFPGLGEASNKVQFYLTWFYDWDLKKLQKH